MKVFKFTALIAGSLIAILAAVAIFYAATFDAEDWKSELTRIVKGRTQRTLKLEGGLTLSFWPRVGIELGRTTLSEYASEKEFAAFDKAKVSLAVLPLLKKRVVVDYVELSGVKANVVRAKDGTLNIDDLIAKDEKQEALSFDVAGVKLEDATLSYHDEESGRMIRLSNATLSTGRIGNAAEGKLALAGRLDGERPSHDADVKLSGHYRYDRGQKSYGLTRLDANANGELAGMKGVDIALAAATLKMQGETGTIEVEKAELSASTKQGQGGGLAVRVDGRRLVIAGDRASSAALNMTAKFTGAEHNVNARFNLSGVEGSTSALEIAKLVLDLDATYADTAIKGAISSPLHADITAHTVELPQVDGQLSLGHPMIPMKPVNLSLNGSAHADWGKQSASGKLAARLDESSIKARWRMSSFNPAVFLFDVDIDRLNVDRYLPPKPGRAATGGRSGSTAAQNRQDFPALKGLNATGSIRIGSLQLNNARATKVRLDIKSDGGKAK